MAREPFLINPAPRKKRKTTSLPSGLLKAMIKKHGPKKAMAAAWASVRGGKTLHHNKWKGHTAEHRTAAKKGWSARKAGRSGYAAPTLGDEMRYYANPRSIHRNKWVGHKAEHRTAAKKGWKRREAKETGYAIPRGWEYMYYANPKRHKKNPFLGEEVLVVGMNPKRKRRKARKTRRSAALSRYMHNPRRRSVRRRARRHNPVRRRRSTAVTRYRRNPVRRYRRRVRRNPVSAMAVGGGINIMKPQTLIVPIAAALGGRVAVKKIPAMLGLTGWAKTGAQVATAVGGGMLLKRVVGQQNAMIFTVVGLATVAEEMLAQYAGISLAGFGDFSAFPLEDSGMGAYTDGDYGAGSDPY